MAAIYSGKHNTSLNRLQIRQILELSNQCKYQWISAHSLQCLQARSDEGRHTMLILRVAAGACQEAPHIRYISQCVHRLGPPICGEISRLDVLLGTISHNSLAGPTHSPAALAPAAWPYAFEAPILSGWPPILPSLIACSGCCPTNAAFSAVARPLSTCVDPTAPQVAAPGATCTHSRQSRHMPAQ